MLKMAHHTDPIIRKVNLLFGESVSFSELDAKWHNSALRITKTMKAMLALNFT